MNVQLIHYNPDALELLLFTKQTRLALSPGLYAEIMQWPMEKKLQELDYMLGTIQSSWEFADYTFLVDGVSRAFTHQFVRSRQGSYAQQSQRTVDMEGFDYIVPKGIAVDGEGHIASTGHSDDMERMGRWLAEFFSGDMEIRMGGETHADNINHAGMQAINYIYTRLRAKGVPPQDARGILPTNVSTNIIAKFNLRSLADMAKLRLCTRTQGEYQDVFRAMRAAVIAVHPWAEPFIRVHCAATGVCCFPNFKECPIKGPVFNPATGRRWDEAEEHRGAGAAVRVDKRPATADEIQAAWETTRYEAIPSQIKTPAPDGTDA
jgi:flavin-dependent thymidylate synthase